MSKFQGMHINESDNKKRNKIRKYLPYYRNIDVYRRGLDSMVKEIKDRQQGLYLDK